MVIVLNSHLESLCNAGLHLQWEQLLLMCLLRDGRPDIQTLVLWSYAFSILVHNVADPELLLITIQADMNTYRVSRAISSANAMAAISCVRVLRWPPAVESSIAVKDAIENRSLYRHFCFAIVLKRFETLQAPLSPHSIARLSPLRGGWASPMRMRDRAR